MSFHIDGDDYGIINAKVMGLKSYDVDSTLKDYSSETISMRLARRKENWCKLYLKANPKGPSEPVDLPNSPCIYP